MLHRSPQPVEQRQLQAVEMVDRIACPRCASIKVFVRHTSRPKRYMACHSCSAHFAVSILIGPAFLEPGQFLMPSGL